MINIQKVVSDSLASSGLLSLQENTNRIPKAILDLLNKQDRTVLEAEVLRDHFISLQFFVQLSKEGGVELNDLLLHEVWRNVEMTELPRHQIIFREKEQSDQRMFILLSGRVCVKVNLSNDDDLSLMKQDKLSEKSPRKLQIKRNPVSDDQVTTSKQQQQSLPLTKINLSKKESVSQPVEENVAFQTLQSIGEISDKDEDDDSDKDNHDRIFPELGVKVAVLEHGSAFGEQALMNEGGQRNASVFTTEPSLFLVIRREKFLGVLNILENSRKDKLRRISKVIPFFDEIASKQLKDRIFYAFREQTFLKGQILTQEGHKGSKIYLLKKGRVTMEKCLQLDEFNEKEGVEKQKVNFNYQFSELSSADLIGDEVLKERSPLYLSNKNLAPSPYQYTSRIVSSEATFFFVSKRQIIKQFPKHIVKALRAAIANKIQYRSQILEESKTKIQSNYNEQSKISQSNSPQKKKNKLQRLTSQVHIDESPTKTGQVGTFIRKTIIPQPQAIQAEVTLPKSQVELIKDLSHLKLKRMGGSQILLDTNISPIKMENHIGENGSLFHSANNIDSASPYVRRENDHLIVGQISLLRKQRSSEMISPRVDLKHLATESQTEPVYKLKLASQTSIKDDIVSMPNLDSLVEKNPPHFEDLTRKTQLTFEVPRIQIDKKAKIEENEKRKAMEALLLAEQNQLTSDRLKKMSSFKNSHKSQVSRMILNNIAQKEIIYEYMKNVSDGNKHESLDETYIRRQIETTRPTNKPAKELNHLRIRTEGSVESIKNQDHETSISIDETNQRHPNLDQNQLYLLKETWDFGDENLRMKEIDLRNGLFRKGKIIKPSFEKVFKEKFQKVDEHQMKQFQRYLKKKQKTSHDESLYMKGIITMTRPDNSSKNNLNSNRKDVNSQSVMSPYEDITTTRHSQQSSVSENKQIIQDDLERKHFLVNPITRKTSSIMFPSISPLKKVMSQDSLFRNSQNKLKKLNEQSKTTEKKEEVSWFLTSGSQEAIVKPFSLKINSQKKEPILLQPSHQSMPFQINQITPNPIYNQQVSSIKTFQIAQNYLKESSSQEQFHQGSRNLIKKDNQLEKRTTSIEHSKRISKGTTSNSIQLSASSTHFIKL